MKRFFLVTTFAASTVVAAAQVLDQSYQPSIPSSSGGFVAGANTNSALAQTFTVGVAGTLTRFDTYISNVGGGLPAHWDIRPTIGGVPVQSDVASLASGSFLSSAAHNNFFTIELGSSSIPVLPGDELAIVFRTPIGFSIGWWGEYQDPYTRGTSYVGTPGTPTANPTVWSTSFLTDSDLGFRTYVIPVPEPSSGLLLTVGVFAFLRVRGPSLKRGSMIF
jgi:hypothetical protein